MKKVDLGFQQVTRVCSKRETIAKYFENNFVWYYNSMVLIKWFVVFSVLQSNLLRTIKQFFNQILLTDTGQDVNVKTSMSNICLNFSSKKINPCENFV